MRKASFIWPWEKSVKKILISSLQNTTVFVWNRTIWGWSMTIHSLFQWEGKSGSKMVGLMPWIEINAFLNADNKISSYWRAVWTSLQFICMSIMSLNQSIDQSILFFFFTSFKNKILSPWYQIREQTFGNQVIVTWIWDQGIKWQSVIKKEMQ